MIVSIPNKQGPEKKEISFRYYPARYGITTTQSQVQSTTQLGSRIEREK